MKRYAILFAPDGKNFHVVKESDNVGKLWDYMNFNRDIALQKALNPKARFQLVNVKKKKVIADTKLRKVI